MDDIVAKPRKGKERARYLRQTRSLCEGIFSAFTNAVDMGLPFKKTKFNSSKTKDLGETRATRRSQPSRRDGITKLLTTLGLW